MEIEGKAINVDVLMSVAEGYLQWKGLSDAQTALSTYNQAIQDATDTEAPIFVGEVQSATSTFYTSLDEAYEEQKVAALIGIGAQLMSW